MSKKLFFEIPNDQEVKAKLVEAVPNNWTWVNGILRAPQNLVSSGQVVTDTGFAIQRFHDIHPTIVGEHRHDGQGRLKPDLLAILVDRKLPSFIRFDEAGYDPHIVTMELAKKVAVAFLKQGYRGRLDFYNGCHDYSAIDNDGRCYIEFQPWDGAPCIHEEEGLQPARIRLEWFYDRIDCIEPIISACRSLNLREYEPVPAPAY